jgi:MYXO-CTERM domain-containing protein
MQKDTIMKTAHIKTALIVCAGVIASGASADIYHWDWSADTDGTSGLNMNGGTFESIHAEFDTDTNRFLWQVLFSDQITDGYTLAVNNGPNPKGHAGELALIYFDAYNGQNTMLTYRDGSPASGDQAPDQIFDYNDASILQASVSDFDGKRQMTLELDASLINGHNPAYPGPEGPGEWTGIGFEEQLGLWMHPLKNLSASYNNENGLSSWSGSQGWFDGAGYSTTTVPAPGAFALLGLGGLLSSRRNRS